MIGKAIAKEGKATFFNISASSLMSKWVGEGEKMVRALFTLARYKQPSIIFIDEVDSILSQRSDGDNDNGVRRMKTEFLIQLDGASTSDKDRVLIVGATNIPQDIDEAVRRRFTKRLYIPLPNEQARRQMIFNLLKMETHSLTEEDIESVVRQSEGYSGSDLKNLCCDAAMNTIRGIKQIQNLSASQVRAISLSDFHVAFRNIRPSVCKEDTLQYEDWNQKFGSM